MYFDYIRLNFITRATMNKSALRCKGKKVSETEYRTKTESIPKSLEQVKTCNLKSRFCQKCVLSIINTNSIFLLVPHFMCNTLFIILVLSTQSWFTKISNKAMQMEQQLEIESNQMGYIKTVIRIRLWYMRRFHFCIARIRSKEKSNCERDRERKRKIHHLIL